MIRIRRGADPDLIVKLPNGLHAAIAMSWTSYAAPSNLDPSPPVIPLLDFNGLRQVAQIIDQIRHAERDRTVEKQ